MQTLCFTIGKGMGDQYEGNGPGLALCKIAEKAHGIITAKEKKDSVAAFIATLPLKQSSILNY